MSHRTPPWRNGDCRGRDISVREKQELERRFAEPIWARVEELKVEEQHRLEDEQLEQQRQDAEYMALYGHTFPGIPKSEVYTDMERNAVMALKEDNDARPLALLLDPRYPFNAYELKHPIWMTLSEETRQLAADIIRGEFKHKGGRPKRGSEKNRDTPSARDRKATHDAVASLPFLRRALRTAYPNQTRFEIGKRTLYMASCKFGISEETIKNYCRLPLGHRLRTSD